MEKEKSLTDYKYKYLEKKKMGMDNSEIRKLLEKDNLTDNEIAIVLRGIGNAVIRAENEETGNEKALGLIFVGIVLLITSVVVFYGKWDAINYAGNKNPLCAAWLILLEGILSFVIGIGSYVKPKSKKQINLFLRDIYSTFVLYKT